MEEVLRPQEAEAVSRLQRAGIICGKLAALASLSLGAGVAGGMLVPTQSELGPHRVEVELTHDDALTLDVGIPGSIIKPVDFGGLGVYIDMKEIPITDEMDIDQSEFGQQDIDNYTRFFSHYESDLESLKHDMLLHMLRFSGAAAGGMLVGYGLLGHRARRALADRSLELGRPVLQSNFAKLATASLLFGGVVISDGVSGADMGGVKVDAVFDDTILEGASIKGRQLHILINNYGREILERIEENNQFYELTRTNLELASDDYVLGRNPNTKTMLFLTDIHCNIGMAEIGGRAAQLFDVDLMASGGDDVVSGTEIEEECIRILDQYRGDIPAVHVGGNHDSDLTEDQLGSRGFVTLDGEPVEVGGLRFVGDDDPRESVFGQSIEPEREETITQMGERLAESACEEDADIILVHDYDAARTVAETGCVNLALSGHQHREDIGEVTTEFGQTTPYIVGESAGGAAHGGSTLGPLQGEARMYLIEFNSLTNRPLRYQTVVFGTDGSVDILSPQRF